ncbi:MAG: pyridoxal-phosphate dependent enzyme, partial [Actinomycetota bacterium]
RSDVLAAAERIRPHLEPTPLVAGLKLETLNPTGSFKVRGALNALLQADEPVVTASAGNFGLGVAWAAQRLGREATVVVAETASPRKIEALRTFDVRLVVHGADYDQAEAHALSLPGRYVSPYNDTEVIAGAGTIALELPADTETVVVPVGGGGLAAGIRLATEARVVGVVPERFPAMPAALAAGRVVEIEGDRTIADALHGNIEPGSVTVDLLAGVDVVEVTEDELAEAMRFLAFEHGIVTEGAGAAATAAIRSGKAPAGVAIVSGRNVAAATFAAVVRG